LLLQDALARVGLSIALQRRIAVAKTPLLCAPSFARTFARSLARNARRDRRQHGTLPGPLPGTLPGTLPGALPGLRRLLIVGAHANGGRWRLAILHDARRRWPRSAHVL
jgi:hypothetical protein